MKALLRDIADGLRAQPGRVGLAFLAVAIGMVALTAQRAISGGLEQRARALVDELGAHVIALLPPETEKEENQHSLTMRHAALLESNLEGRPVARWASRKVPLSGVGSIPVIATEQHLAEVRRWGVGEGRFLDAADLAQGSRHAVLTPALAARGNWHPGSVILLQNLPFTVVGVLEGTPPAAGEGAATDRLRIGPETVFVPFTASLPWVQESDPGERALDMLFVGGRSADEPEALIDACRGLLAAPDAGGGVYNFVSPETLVASLRKLQQTLRWSVGGIALLCLLLGGTTLMSLMMANVRDRVSEIGLRRALGARTGDVAALFVVESCLVTVAAALVGGFVAGLVLGLVRARFPLPLSFSPDVFAVPVLASIALGTIFSYGPARMAARISPAEALRNE